MPIAHKSLQEVQCSKKLVLRATFTFHYAITTEQTLICHIFPMHICSSFMKTICASKSIQITCIATHLPMPIIPIKF